jgi:hypothetical protein
MTFQKKSVYFLLISVVIFIFGFGFTACNDDIFSTNPNDKLAFSKDTLAFDTVFTTIGTATSKILIYNRHNEALKISNIQVAGGRNSYFKINVDGNLSENNSFNNVEIRANDSMYVFVQLKVDPTDSNSPVFIEDSLVFLTNGVKQNIKLQAYGQDMKVLKNAYFLNDTTLNSLKPYLIYGYLAIDTAKTLTLSAGCKLYFHNNANLIVYGNLIANGTADNPILMRGDRLDKIKYDTPFPYNNVAGQWGGVYLLWSGGNHVLEHVIMNSGYVGIYLSNSNWNVLPNLKIADCKIHNFLMYNLVVQNGNVQVTNSEISNSSSYTVYLNGGKHSFIQSTIVNYFNSGLSVQPVGRDKNPTVMIMNLNRNAPMQTVFKNCIVTGNSANEFSLATRYIDQYKGVFDHCYIKKTDSLTLSQFTNIRWVQPKDTLIFKSIYWNYEKGTYYNFMPDSISPVRGIADPTIAAQFPIDLNGNNRMADNKPDLGAYQWQPIKK